MKINISRWKCKKKQDIYKITNYFLGFRGNSAVKEPTCNAGDPFSIPGLERSPEEGIDYLFQYSWASLVAQTVKNPPTMWETWVQSLGWEDPMEESMVTQASILVWRIPMDRGAWWATVLGVTKSQTWLSNKAQHTKYFSPQIFNYFGEFTIESTYSYMYIIFFKRCFLVLLYLSVNWT